MLKYRTFENIVEWVRINRQDIESPNTATLWFLACKNAKGIFEEFRPKDLAEMLLDGVEPITPESFDEEWITYLASYCYDGAKELNIHLPGNDDESYIEYGYIDENNEQVRHEELDRYINEKCEKEFREFW